MSGHSKWHNIQAHKGKQDKMKASAFTKVGRMITVAARTGGGDPEMNFSLRLAIDKAKEVNLPKDNIERAIKKGTGDLKDDSVIEEILYEGFGPGGVGVLVDVLTDNKNRTAPEIRHMFSLHNGSAAGPGSVTWQFNRLGVVRIDKDHESEIKNQDEFELHVIDAGAEDIKKSDFGIEIFSPVGSFQDVVEAVKTAGITPADMAIEWIAKEHITLDAEKSAQLSALVVALEDMDDVRAVYTNAA